MLRRSDSTLIFVGDLVRAVHELQPPPEALPLIARMLQLEGVPPVSVPKPLRRRREDANSDVAQRRREQETITPDGEREDPPPVVALAKPQPEATRIQVVPISIEAVHDKDQEEMMITLAPPAQMPAATDEEDEPDPELLPLLDPATLRSAIVSAVETRSLETVPDVDALTDMLVRGEVIREIPFVKSPTVRRGVQVLVDRGSGMVPFARDADQLAAAIAALVNESSTHVLRFRTMPTWSVYDSRGVRRPYDFAPVGVPVVIISDFGMSREALPDVRPVLADWVQLLRELRARRSSVVAFVPYERDRWPRELVSAAVLVQWDRGASSTTIRAARERLDR
jgi:hypothetical protein